MTVLRLILIPFSVIYSLIISIRNKLYDQGFIKSFKVSRPVISIGNITTGGTGKTPLTILIAKHYLSKGTKIGIISRGYKRKTGAMVIVSDGKKVSANIDQSGDELILIANELLNEHKDNFCIAASSNRVETAEYLIKEFNPGVIILDDSFQHRKIKRDLDIVIIDSQNYLKERFLNTFTLPSGILRESVNSLTRAGLVIQNNKNSDIPYIEDLEKSGKEKITMRYKTEYIMDDKNSILKNHKGKAIVFSGIANNISFLEMIKSESIKISEVIEFSDHHNYSNADIDFLKSKHSDSMIYITTEKDFVKIKQFSDFIKLFPVYFLKLNCEIDNGKHVFFTQLDNLIK